jgi:phosphate transport system substrate-binding protein
MRLASFALLALALAGAGCGKNDKDKGPVGKPSGDEGGGGGGGANELTGAGATFPYPLYSKWMHSYNQKTGVKINYQSIGSGGGIKQITAQTVDFGASDAPMKDDELAAAPGKIVHIPTTLGAVVVAYNVDGLSEPLKLTPDTVAGIFLGDIKKWNDARLAADNPGTKLPDKDITPVYRSDGSGTTAVFTDYLAKISPAWKDKVGAGKSVKFPAGLGAKGNEGVAGQIKTSPGAVGYIELAYAKQTNQPYAHIKNAAGQFVDATEDAITAAAAASANDIPADYRVSVTNASGAASYPIAAFTYLLVYEDAKDAAKGKTLAEFLWWAIHDGQEMGPPLHYAKLPPELVTKIEATLKGLKAGGRPALAQK